MKILKLKNLLILLVSLFFAVFYGCNEDPTASLYDPDVPGGVTPVINSVEPAGGALAGVTRITITGSNFSAVKTDNQVYFNGKKAVVEEASAIQLVVVSPIVTGDSVSVKVAVSKAVLLSNILHYKLSPAMLELTKPNGDKIFTDLYIPFAIAADASDNLYVSVTGPGPGVKKILPDGTANDYAPKGAETFWTSLKMGPANVLFASKGIRGIWDIIENTPPANAPWVATPTGSRIIDSDFDAALNLWGVGNNTNIFKLKPDKTFEQFPFTANLRTVRVFDNALYAGGQMDDMEGVWKFTFDAGNNIGTPELYFNLTELNAAAKVYAVTFAADGDMYVGTDLEKDPIIVVHTDKTSEPLYPGVIAPKTIINTFTWDTGNFLYFSRSQTLSADGALILAPTVIKLNMQKPGAPYFGRQ
jgi:hypothetical protein